MSSSTDLMSSARQESSSGGRADLIRRSGAARREVRLLLFSPASASSKRQVMTSTAKSTETWQVVMELRGQKEIVERWLTSQGLSENERECLRAMLRDIDEQLRTSSNRSQE